MTDFTKEELERINYILKKHDFREGHLINKIQSMVITGYSQREEVKEQVNALYKAQEGFVKDIVDDVLTMLKPNETNKNCEKLIDLAQNLYINLSALIAIINEDGNEIWEQPKLNCKKIDYMAMQIREKLPEFLEKLLTY